MTAVAPLDPQVYHLTDYDRDSSSLYAQTASPVPRVAEPKRVRRSSGCSLMPTRVFAEFLGYSSAHGLAGVQRNAHVFKCVWVLLVLGAWGVMSFQVYKTVSTYLKYPVDVNLQIRRENKVDFPAVTLCNLNPVRFNKLQEAAWDGNEKASELIGMLQASPKVMDWGAAETAFHADYAMYEKQWRPGGPEDFPDFGGGGDYEAGAGPDSATGGDTDYGSGPDAGVSSDAPMIMEGESDAAPGITVGDVPGPAQGDTMEGGPMTDSPQGADGIMDQDTVEDFTTVQAMGSIDSATIDDAGLDSGSMIGGTAASDGGNPDEPVDDAVAAVVDISGDSVTGPSASQAVDEPEEPTIEALEDMSTLAAVTMGGGEVSSPAAPAAASETAEVVATPGVPELDEGEPSDGPEDATEATEAIAEGLGDVVVTTAAAGPTQGVTVPESTGGVDGGMGGLGGGDGPMGRRRRRKREAEWDDEEDWDELLVPTEEESLALGTASAFYSMEADYAQWGHQLEDMLLDCSFKGAQCFPDEFQRWEHPQYGNCYTFFGDVHANNSQSGPTYGLKLTLFIQDEEYLPRVSPAGGFRVQISPGSYYPLPEDYGFTLSPGFSTSAAVTLRKINRLPLPYDGTDCDEYDEKDPKGGLFSYWRNIRKNAGAMNVTAGTSAVVNYTNGACVKSCEVEAVMTECGCVLATHISWRVAKRVLGLANYTKFPACDGRNTTQYSCAVNAMEDTQKQCIAQCLQPCEEDSYPAKVTGAVWPRAAYFHQMKDMWLGRIPTASFHSVAEGRDELARLEVYFQELNFETVSESENMSFWSLLSNFGGTLGLYGGLSFLTVFEFVELILRCLSNQTVEEEEEKKNQAKVRDAGQA